MTYKEIEKIENTMLELCKIIIEANKTIADLERVVDQAYEQRAFDSLVKDTHV